MVSNGVGIAGLQLFRVSERIQIRIARIKDLDTNHKLAIMCWESFQKLENTAIAHPWRNQAKTRREPEAHSQKRQYIWVAKLLPDKSFLTEILENIITENSKR